MSSSGVYKFTEQIQLKILALLWLDNNSFSMYQDVIQPKYFVNPIHVDLCRFIFDYQQKYRMAPTSDVLVEESVNICESSKKKQPLLRSYIKCIDQMSKMNFDDESYIKDKIISFGKRQALVDAVLESATILEKEPETKYGDIEGIIKSALLVGENSTDLGINLFDNIEERLHTNRHRET